MAGRRLKNGDHCAAIVIVYDSAHFTKNGRRAVAAWLAKKAVEMKSNVKGFPGRTQFRYLY